MRYLYLLTGAALGALSLVFAARGEAQFAELQPGARVRVRAPDVLADRLEARIVARSPDTVTLTTTRGAPVSVPLAAITAVDVSRGRSPRDGAVKGLAWGAGVGVAVWAFNIIGYDKSYACGDERCDDDLSPGVYVAAGLVTGAALGAGIGAIVGAEHWEPLSIPAHIALRPSSRAFTLAASIQF